MAAKHADLIPVAHRAFLGEIDAAYIDSEDIPIKPVMHFSELRNLHPLRKEGSLTMAPGHSFVKAFASMPGKAAYGLTGFEPVDFYYYKLDKNSTEITLLFFKHTSTGEIRIFADKWWNPTSSNSNYSTAYTENAWGTTWTELTESTIQKTILTEPDDYTITFSDVGLNTSCNVSGYFNGFFSLIYVQDHLSTQPFNLVTSHTYSAGTHTLVLKGKSSVAGAMVPVYVQLFRFPVKYMYNANIVDYSGAGSLFKGMPTDYLYQDGMLRMPCGKDNRPLILQFINQRKYFLGNLEIDYDGLWFDFQQLPQRQKNSCVTGFKTLTQGTVGTAYINAANSQLQAGAPANGIAVTNHGGVNALRVHVTPSYIPTNPLHLNPDFWHFPALIEKAAISTTNPVAGWNLWLNKTVTITIAELVSWLNSADCPLSQSFSFSVVGAGNMYTTAEAHSSTTLVGTGNIFGTEAGGNHTAENLFIGASFTSIENTDVVTNPIHRTAFIVNLLYDNRSEIMLCNGTMHAITDGGKIQFNLWFSRRITGWKVYNKSHDDINPTGGAGTVPTWVASSDTYPYYKWWSEVGINELRLFATYSIYDFTKSYLGGEIVNGVKALTDISAGKNCYTFDATTGKYYSLIQDGLNGWDTVGQGLRYLADCNRYIDEDTTMNYIRGDFVGQTNGRFFIIGVKNTVENEPFEPNDTLCYNLYSGAVSEYDTFPRVRSMPVFLGDKDSITDIVNHKGFLTIIKDTNVYALDANTDNEVNYAIIDTQLGRGTSNYNNILQTNHGIILKTSDGVWLITTNGMKRILRPNNGKLALYKSILAYPYQFMIYDNAYNELLLFFNDPGVTGIEGGTIACTVLVYSFERDMWACHYEYVDYVKCRSVRTNSNQQICVLNVKDIDNYNIIKIDENQPLIIDTGGTLRGLSMGGATHKMAYSGRINDQEISAITFHIDYAATANVNISLSHNKDSDTPTTDTLVLPTATNKIGLIKESLVKEGMCSLFSESFTINDTHLTYLSINSFYLWMSIKHRQIQVQ